MKLKRATEYWISPPSDYTGKFGKYDCKNGRLYTYFPNGKWSSSSGFFVMRNRNKTMNFCQTLPNGSIMEEMFFTSKGRFCKRAWIFRDKE